MTESPDVKVFEKCQEDARILINKQVAKLVTDSSVQLSVYEYNDLVLRTAITLFIRQVRR